MAITRLAGCIAIAGLAICLAGRVMAQEPDSKVSAGLYKTKDLLLLMDQDHNGKVSKAEFMKFMEAEFDALDVSKDGELDVAELTGVRVRRSNPTNHK